MVLFAVKGQPNVVNPLILVYASQSSPVLVVDCANCADPHKLLPYIPEEKLFEIYVVEVELLYTFRDILCKLETLAQQLGVKTIVVPTFTRMFHYHDENENRMIYMHAWELLKSLSEKYTVIVGVQEGSVHELLAEHVQAVMKTGGEIMGHTVMSQRMAADIVMDELKAYGKALRASDRDVYAEVLKEPLKHIGSVSYASSMHVWAFLLLSTIVEQEKKIRMLEDQYESMAYRLLQEREERRALAQDIEG